MSQLTVADLMAAKGAKTVEGPRTLTVRDLIAVGSGNQSAEYLRQQKMEEGQRIWAQRRGAIDKGDSTVKSYERSKGLAENARDVGRMGLEMAATTAAVGPGLAAKIGLPLAKKALQAGVAGGASSLASEAFDPSKDPLKRAAQTAAFAAGGEGVGGAIARGLNRVIKGGMELESGAAEAYAQIEKHGGQVLPGQLTTNPAVDVLQNISQSSLFGFRKFQVITEAGEGFAQADIDKHVASYLRGRGSEVVGGGVQDAIIASSQMRRKIGSELFGFVDELIDLDMQAGKISTKYMQKIGGKPGAMGVDLESALSLADKELKRSGGRNEKIAKVAKWITDAAEDGKTISFSEAQSLRSDLLGIGRIGDEIIQGQAQAVAKRLAHKIDSAMMEHARQLGPGIETSYRAANAFWKKTSKTYGDRFIKSLLKSEPERILKKVSNKDMPGTIRKVRNAIMDPLLSGTEMKEAEAVWREVQGHALLRILNSAKDASSQVSGKRATKLLGDFGEEALDELFLNKTEVGAFKKLIRTLEIVQAPAGEGLPGGVFVQLGQAGAAIGLMTGHFGPQAVAFVIAPEVLKAVLTNKAFTRWAVLGRNAKPGSKAALRAYTRMQAIVASETIHHEKQKQQETTQ